MASTRVTMAVCYICKKSNSKSLRRWESKIGCTTCRNYFSLRFDLAFKAINEQKIENIDKDISDENGKVISIFWTSINSILDCYRVLNFQDYSKLCIHKGHPISKCTKCKFRRTFFIFSLPCTKHAKLNLPLFIKIRENWSLIKYRLKERILGNEAIEMGESDTLGNDTIVSKLGKSIRKTEKSDLNPLAVYRVTAQYRRPMNVDSFVF